MTTAVVPVATIKDLVEQNHEAHQNMQGAAKELEDLMGRAIKTPEIRQRIAELQAFMSDCVTLVLTNNAVLSAALKELFDKGHLIHKRWLKDFLIQQIKEKRSVLGGAKIDQIRRILHEIDTRVFDYKGDSL